MKIYYALFAAFIVNYVSAMEQDELQKYIVHTQLIEQVMYEDDVESGKVILRKIGYEVNNREDSDKLGEQYKNMKQMLESSQPSDQTVQAAQLEIQRIREEIKEDQSQDFAQALVHELERQT